MRVDAVKAKLPGLRKNRNRAVLVITDMGTQEQSDQATSGMNQLPLVFFPLLLYFASLL